MHLYDPSCKLVLLSDFDGLSTSDETDLIESVSIAQAQTIYVFQLTAIIQNLTVYVQCVSRHRAPGTGLL